MITKQIARGFFQVGFGQVVEYLTSFIRNIIIARLLSPHDMGISVTFVITISLLEMISNLSIEKLIVQSDQGNEPGFQRTVQAIQGARGILVGLCIFMLSNPISRLFSIPDASWAFRVLAIVPVLHGLRHLDMVRVQRDLDFFPSVSVPVFANVVVTLAAWPLGRMLGNFSVVLWILGLRGAIVTIGSHLVARTRYSWAYQLEHVQHAFSFGWPLMINGLLMFFIFQGDRFLISAAPRWFPDSSYTMADLGVYSVAFSLVMAPTLMLSNTSSALLLPLLSRCGSDKIRFFHIYTLCTQTLTTVACIIAVLLVVAGGQLMILIYGSNYAGANAFIGWLSLMQSMRLIRQAPTMAAMAKGDTQNAMISNFSRSVALVAVLLVIATGGSLGLVAAAGFAGEVLALLVCTMRLQRMYSVPAMTLFIPVLAFFALISIAATTRLFPVMHASWPVPLAVASVYMLFATVVLVLLFPGLPRKIWRLLTTRGIRC